jgi:hypothetical protein
MNRRDTLRFTSISSWGVHYDTVLYTHVVELYCEGTRGANKIVHIPVSRAHVEALAHALGAAIAHEQKQQADMLEYVEDEIAAGKDGAR